MVSHRCRTLSRALGERGVGALRPAREELAKDRIGRNDADDALMVALSRLIFDLSLPTEEAGKARMYDPDREEYWVRKLFERAVGGFYRFELESKGWSIRCGEKMSWPFSEASDGLAAILPMMYTDIQLDESGSSRRIVIDTKFAAIVTPGRFGNDRLSSTYIYQLYTYLRSQEDKDARWQSADGILLHPAIGTSVNENAIIQGHRMFFATVDLGGSSDSIRARLRQLIDPYSASCAAATGSP
jgi:5-methylcytosine-specific restriction enzyme subunit McrC